MNTTFKIFVGCFVFLVVYSCSTKKDAFINRSYHSVATKYNVLYNGNESLRIGLENLNANYEDNFWELLPIEPLKVDVLALPGMQKDTDNSPKEFERAEEKAVKAVQKHSMVIARQERNNQIDEAYLLLGKARYYSKRFVPALEAFNYVIINYPNADLINETKIWQSKTHIRLRNEEQAIENLKILLKDKHISEKIKESAHTAIAMAYVKTDSLQQVINHLNKAVTTNNYKKQKARNLFVLGQIYREKNAIDSSNMAFQKVIDYKKSPYKYKIQAYIEKAKNSSNKLTVLEMKETLLKLLKDRDNRPFLDQLYFQLGELEKKNNPKSAIAFFKKSIAASTAPNYQKELSYQAIGDLYFDLANFSVAGAYYDSILDISQNKNSKRIRRLTRRRKNLNEVILYESIAKVNDSILKIAALSKDQQEAFFTKHIEKLIAQEKEQQQQKTTTGTAFFNSNNSKDVTASSGGTWYFYNVQTAGFGVQEFKRIWGNRPLEDNWRLSEKSQLSLDPNETVATQNTMQVNTSKKLELSYYLEKIPTNKFKIDSIVSQRNSAYLKLGILYKEQFKEIDLAISKLEKLLSFNPSTVIELPAKYHLFKIYQNKNAEKAATIKNEIITNFATSNYAKAILNPTKNLSQNNANSPESEYAILYYEFKAENYDDVIEKSTQAISNFEGLPIVPKFELLKAYAIGKKEGLAAFKKALDFVSVNYPNTEEGKKALEVSETIKTKI